MSITLVGVFDEYSQAQTACRKLEQWGIDKNAIQVSGGEPDASMPPARSSDEPPEKQGAISRFFSELFGDSEKEDAANYSEAVRRGSSVVTVNITDEDRVDEISDILEDCGAVDVDERVQDWKASGYTPAATAGATAMPRPTGEKDDVLEAVEEELKVGKRTVEQGGVRVRRHMTQRPVEEQVSLHSERAQVDRQKVDRPATEADLQSAFKDKDIELRETSEEPVVSKSARVVEEVRFGTQGSDRTETISDKLRSAKVEVEKIAGAALGGRQPRDDMTTQTSHKPKDDMAKQMSRFSGAERRANSGRPYGGVERRASAPM